MARKTKIFKVLCFEPNFRGRLFMTSMDMIWIYFLKKHPTKLIYSWLNLISCFSSGYKSDRFKLFQILSAASPVLGFCFQTLLICIGNIIKVFTIKEITFSVSFWISSSTHLHVLTWKTMSFTRKLVPT